MTAEDKGIVPYLFSDDAIHQIVKLAGGECDAPVERDFGVRILNVPDGMGCLRGFMRRNDE